MTAQHVDHLSWWAEAMTWEQFHEAVMAHVPIWKRQKISLDHVGATLMRDAWEPRRDPSHPRAALK